MKNKIYILPLLFIMVACNGQDKKKEKEKPKTVQKEQTKGTNPKMNVKVNKQYDSKGNLIKFDSTYTYYYSAKGNDSVKVSIDTVFEKFKRDMDHDFSDMAKNRFNDIFLNDSLFKYDFLNEDFFSKRFQLNDEKINKIFIEMDSLKNQYLNKPRKEKPKKQTAKK
jgi:hypothetical protein